MQRKAHLRRRIRQLQKEVAAIEKGFFAPHENSLSAERWALERKKEHLIRLVVMELHLAIEDLITDAIIGHLTPRRRQHRASARSLTTPGLYELLRSERAIGFPSKLALAHTLRLITSPTANRLKTLNTLRNRCSHHWLLNVVRRRNVKPEKPKKHLLNYEGQGLYIPKNLERFIDDYTKIYLRLFLKFA